MTPQEQIRKLAFDTADKLENVPDCCGQLFRGGFDTPPECCGSPIPRPATYEETAEFIQAAILEGVKLALAEPSQEMRKRGNEAIGLEQPIRPSTVWRAMSAVRLRALGVEE